MNHTSAPWTAEVNQWETEQQGRPVLTGWITGPGPLHDQVTEYAGCGSHNAQWNNPADLILAVAAPDLYAALTALYAATPDNEGGALGAACRQARAALAKADGR